MAVAFDFLYDTVIVIFVFIRARARVRLVIAICHDGDSGCTETISRLTGPTPRERETSGAFVHNAQRQPKPRTRRVPESNRTTERTCLTNGLPRRRWFDDGISSSRQQHASPNPAFDSVVLRSRSRDDPRPRSMSFLGRAIALPSPTLPNAYREQERSEVASFAGAIESNRSERLDSRKKKKAPFVFPPALCFPRRS